MLQFLAASPLFAHSALAQQLRSSDPADWAPREVDRLIADPRQALDVFDFEPVMRQNVPPAHFGYMATGVDDEVTLRANRESFRKFELRPRRLVDVSMVDTSAEIFGFKYDSPIVIAPTGSNRAFHADAEIAVAKAAKAGNHLQILSTVATTSIEDAIAARGAPVWFQLYTTQRFEIAEALVKRAEAAGAPVIAVTLDVRAPAKWTTFTRLRRADTRECASCHGTNDYLARKPNFAGINLAGVSGTVVTNLTWDLIKRLRDTVKGRLVLKGILAFEDAKLAADAGIDAIVVSNHGGRVEDGVSATIDVLPEIVEARRPNAGADRQRLSPRQRHRQGPGDRCAGGLHRPALSVGARRFRPARGRTRARNPARRDPGRDAAARRAVAQGAHTADGAAGLRRRAM